MKDNIDIMKMYYLLTPLFLAVELAFDINIRISIPGDSGTFRYIYYAVCFLCAFFVFRNPVTASIFSLSECVINILLLILSVLYPVFTLPAAMGGGNMTNIKFSMSDLVHFILVGGILLYAYYTNPLVNRFNKFRIR